MLPLTPSFFGTLTRACDAPVFSPRTSLLSLWQVDFKGQVRKFTDVSIGEVLVSMEEFPGSKIIFNAEKGVKVGEELASDMLAVFMELVSPMWIGK